MLLYIVTKQYHESWPIIGKTVVLLLVYVLSLIRRHSRRLINARHKPSTPERQRPPKY
jgi:hypothetical protein